MIAKYMEELTEQERLNNKINSALIHQPEINSIDTEFMSKVYLSEYMGNPSPLKHLELETLLTQALKKVPESNLNPNDDTFPKINTLLKSSHFLKTIFKNHKVLLVDLLQTLNCPEEFLNKTILADVLVGENKVYESELYRLQASITKEITNEVIEVSSKINKLTTRYHKLKERDPFYHENINTVSPLVKERLKRYKCSTEQIELVEDTIINLVKIHKELGHVTRIDERKLREFDYCQKQKEFRWYFFKELQLIVQKHTLVPTDKLARLLFSLLFLCRPGYTDSIFRNKPKSFI